MEKFNELAKNLGMTKEELEQMLLDKELFLKVFSLFENMSKRGKDTTIETLVMYMLKEEAENVDTKGSWGNIKNIWNNA